MKTLLLIGALMTGLTAQVYAVWPPAPSLAEPFPLGIATGSFILGIGVGLVGSLLFKKR